MRAFAEAFTSSAYPTISDEGRMRLLDRLWESCRRVEKLGWKALYELELAYPESGSASLDDDDDHIANS